MRKAVRLNQPATYTYPEWTPVQSIKPGDILPDGVLVLSIAHLPDEVILIMMDVDNQHKQWTYSADAELLVKVKL